MPVSDVYGAQTPRVRSVLDVQNGLAAQEQNALGLQDARLKLAQQQQAITDQNALRAAAQSFGDDTTANYNALLRTGNVKAAADYQKSILDAGKTRADTSMANAHAGLFNADSQTKALAAYRTVLPMVQNPDQFSQWVDGMASDPRTADIVKSQGGADAIKARVPQDPAQFQQFLQMNAMGMDNFIKNQTQLRGQDITRQNTIDTNQTHLQTTGMNNATTLKATSIREGGENNRAALSRQTQFTLAGLNPDGSAATGDADREKQLTYWSEVIRNGGSLPPGLARGRDGSAFVRAVTQRAAMGPTSPTDLMANQAEFGGAKAAQRTLGNRQANIEMAATEAYNMIPIAVDASNKVDRTQFPNLNSVLLAAQKGTGDQNVVKLATATNSLINSYSRAISPTGTPTVSDKEHAREILDKAFSKGQYQAATDIMQQEIEAARKSPVQVREHMRGKPDAPVSPKVVNFSDLK